MIASEAILFLLLLSGEAGIGIKYAITPATITVRGIERIGL